MMTVRYPISALIADYALGISSTVICLVMVITSGGTGKLGLMFIALTLCCLAYTIRTVLQHKSVFDLDDQGITRTLFGSVRRIDWGHLQSLSLRYYPRKRAKKKGSSSVLGWLGRRGFDEKPMATDQKRSPFADGWMELTLRGRNKQRMTVESSLPHFIALTDRAAAAARANGLELDPVSDDNLQSLINLPEKFRSNPISNIPAKSNSRAGL